MKNDLSDWDLSDRELENRILGGQAPAPAKRRAPPSRLRPKPRRSRLTALPLAAAAALAAITVMLAFALRRGAEPGLSPEPPIGNEPVTFVFGGRVLTAVEGLPLNPYDKNAFGADEAGRLTYELDGRSARTGIDVSTHQKDIDWKAVAADGIDFAILRLGYRGYTEGKLFQDQAFEQNLRGALETGLDIGVYFFSL